MKADLLRQSAGTDGAYSDFEEEEDEGEQAAVGSGIVETNENYDQDGDEDDDDEDSDGENGYQDFNKNHADGTDSAGETSLIDGKMKPQGQIAKLVQ